MTGVQTCALPISTPSGKKENVELVEIPHAGHFELIDPASEAFKQVRTVAMSEGGLQSGGKI